MKKELKENKVGFQVTFYLDIEKEKFEADENFSDTFTDEVEKIIREIKEKYKLDIDFFEVNNSRKFFVCGLID